MVAAKAVQFDPPAFRKIVTRRAYAPLMKQEVFSLMGKKQNSRLALFILFTFPPRVRCKRLPVHPLPAYPGFFVKKSLESVQCIHANLLQQTSSPVRMIRCASIAITDTDKIRKVRIDSMEKKWWLTVRWACFVCTCPHGRVFSILPLVECYLMISASPRHTCLPRS